MHLDELLSDQRRAIIQRWMERVNGTLVPEGMGKREIVDHLPKFLDEIVVALRRTSSPDSSPNAAQHGLQRLRLGFDVGAVVREYGELRNAICDLARTCGVMIRDEDHHVLTQSMVTGIADAVSEYGRQRDAELRRQATQHFAFVAHELRNPLQTARLSLGFLDRGSHPRAARSLEGSLDRMHELIEHSLELARLGSGIDVELETIQVNELLKSVQTECLPSAEMKGIDLRIEKDANGAIEVDRRLIRSALVNLIGNAIKFSPSGSSIEVRVQTSDRRISFEVEDCCGGLPPGMVESAFNPFVQHHGRNGGFGLGLAIVKQAADAHGGRVRIQDIPGKGCIFALDLGRGA